MNRTDLINTAAILLALAGSVAGVAWLRQPPPMVSVAAPTTAASLRWTILPDGGRALPDARGVLVPARDYRRIASLSLASDLLLVELLPHGRHVAASAFSFGRANWRLEGLPRLDGLKDVERLIALKPDLVVATVFAGEEAQAARLREAGIMVWDLGPMRGRATLERTAIEVSALLNNEDLGRRWAASFARRLDAVASALPATAKRKRAVWLMPIMDKLYGGTKGTSYHDVLTSAGLIDAAAERYRDWPDYAPEHLIAMDPDVLIVASDKAAVLRRMPGLAGLRAVRDPDGIIEIPSDLADVPGPPMLEAAEELFARAYGRPSSR